MTVVDLNADLGEGAGCDPALLDLVSSANVACGGHAGDAETMFTTLRSAAERGVTVGAHPGYADREGFGRRVIEMSPEQVGRVIAAQIGSLQAVAVLAGCKVRYVKPHGALANLAAADRKVADAITDAVYAVSPDLAVLAMSGSALEAAARAQGLSVYSEVFADRAYLSNGRLVPREQPGAMIEDAEAAADRLLAFLASGLMPTLDGAPVRLVAQSVCLHGDSPGALAMARQIRSRFVGAGVSVRPFLPA